MILAAAQTRPHEGDLQANLEDHLAFLQTAGEAGADLILFPEMSLTTYMREGAQEAAFSMQDERLAPLREMAASQEIMAIIGAPIQTPEGLVIGSFILHANGDLSHYAKQYLHDGEEAFFVPSFAYNPLLEMGSLHIALAICADIEEPKHPENASMNGATLYAAGIFYTPGGIDGGHETLSGYARKYQFPVLMANYVGLCAGFEGGGKSAFWDEKGKQIAALGAKEEGLLLVEM